jgi:hypothetical protein
MRIAALGNLGNPEATSPATRAVDGRDAVRIAGHVVLQAAFLAPGLAMFGVRGWRLLGASLGGSASFTLLSWLWAYANGFKLTPLTPGASTAPTTAAPEADGQLGRAPTRKPRPKGALSEATDVDFIDV